MSEFSITCTKENLLLGLTRVAPIAGRNTQLPILQHILLQSKEGSLHLTSTDLELGVHTIIGGKTEGSGSVTVPARNFLAYIQQLPTSNPLTLRATQQGVHISTTGFDAQFPIGSAEDFPLLPKGEKKHAITLEAGMFCRALGQVLFAASREETRPEIRGVYIHIEDGVVRLAATDSFRLAEEITPYQGGQEANFILPLPSAQEVMRLFASQEKISIAPQDSHILIFSDEVEVSSRLVDGQYPDYQQIIPQKSTTSITVPREDLLRALKTLTVFLPRDSRRVELDIQPRKGVLVARVVGSGTGEGVVEVPIEATGDSVKVLINIQYILDGLQHVSGDVCVIGVSGEASPLVLKPSGEKQKYVYVVMPIRS